MNQTQMLPQMMVNANELHVDHSYQRRLDMTRVNTMAEHFNRNLVRIPVVSVRESGIYILDGQHTIALLKKVGVSSDKIPVQYHIGLTVEQEAREFRELNKIGREGRLPVPIADRFRSSIASKEPEEIAINRIVEGLGLRVCRQIKNGINAIESLYWAHSNGNLEVTLWTLKTWGQEDGKAYENDLIRSVSAFYKQYPEADPSRLAKSLATLLPSELKSRLIRGKKSFGNLGVSYKGQIMVLQDCYNKGLKKNRLA